jgi:hypothetical protein
MKLKANEKIWNSHEQGLEPFSDDEKPVHNYTFLRYYKYQLL